MILLIGGTGAIGAPLLEALARGSSPILLLARDSIVATLPGVRIIEGDIERSALGMSRDDAAFVKANLTTLIHAAALTRFDAPLEAARRVNVQGTRNVLEFAAECPRMQRLCALS